MLKAAIEKIIEVSGPKIVTDNAGAMYSVSNGGIEQIRPELDYIEPISLNSLDALVQMVKSEATLFEGGPDLPIRARSSDGVLLRASPQ